MASNILKTRIQNKADDLSTWLSSDAVLLDGEIAVVRLSGDYDIRLKVGNGVDPFSQLPYVDQSEIDSLLNLAQTISSGLSAYALSSDVSSEISSLRNKITDEYLPLSGDKEVANSLSIGSELYVQDRSLSTILSEDASRVFFREWD